MVIDRKWTFGTNSKSGSFFHHFVAHNRYPYTRHVCKTTRLQGCRWRWCCRAATSTSRMRGCWGWHGYGRLIATGWHSSYIMFIKFQWHRHCDCLYSNNCNWTSTDSVNTSVIKPKIRYGFETRSETKPGQKRTFYLPKIYTTLEEVMVMVHLTNLLWLWIGCRPTRSHFGVTLQNTYCTNNMNL